MPEKNSDAHGNVPDESSVAMLLIDVINDFEFEEGERLLEQTLPVAANIAALKKRAAGAGIPAIYVNDNFGKWRSDFTKQVEHCLQDGVLGRPVAELLRPSEEDYFVLKPKHSAFYSTALDLLLDYLKVRTVILTGIAGNICVLFTANDAYMRDLRLVIPSDCIASNTPEENERALRQMKETLGAETCPSTELDLDNLIRKE